MTEPNRSIRPVITIDGAPYEIAAPEELSFAEIECLFISIRRALSLATKRSLSREETLALFEAVRSTTDIVAGAVPRRELARLSLNQLFQIAGLYTKPPLVERVMVALPLAKQMEKARA